MWFIRIYTKVIHTHISMDAAAILFVERWSFCNFRGGKKGVILVADNLNRVLACVMWPPGSIVAWRELEVLPGWQKYFKYQQSLLGYSELANEWKSQIWACSYPFCRLPWQIKHLCMWTPQNLTCGGFFNVIALFLVDRTSVSSCWREHVRNDKSPKGKTTQVHCGLPMKLCA